MGLFSSHTGEIEEAAGWGYGILLIFDIINSSSAGISSRLAAQPLSWNYRLSPDLPCLNPDWCYYTEKVTVLWTKLWSTNISSPHLSGFFCITGLHLDFWPRWEGWNGQAEVLLSDQGFDQFPPLNNTMKIKSKVCLKLFLETTSRLVILCCQSIEF